MNRPITDDEIRNVAMAMGYTVEGEVMIGLLDRIVDLQRRVSELESVTDANE